MKSRDVIQMLLEDGWVQVRVKGSHVQFNPPPLSVARLLCHIRKRTYPLALLTASENKPSLMSRYKP